MNQGVPLCNHLSVQGERNSDVETLINKAVMGVDQLQH